LGSTRNDATTIPLAAHTEPAQGTDCPPVLLSPPQPHEPHYTRLSASPTAQYPSLYGAGGLRGFGIASCGDTRFGAQINLFICHGHHFSGRGWSQRFLTRLPSITLFPVTSETGSTVVLPLRQQVEVWLVGIWPVSGGQTNTINGGRSRLSFLYSYSYYGIPIL
jgi:hypothetical protein